MTGLPSDRYERLKALMDRLRTDCPWDRTQTFATIAPYTIEEAYEVKDAIDRGDFDDLKSELGDLLFQVLFHARLASEENAFNFDDVADTLVEKMVRRHPHVFGGEEKTDWEAIKASERIGQGTLDGVAMALPALMRAQKLQKRAAKVGFDWPDNEGVLDKIVEEAGELKDAVPQDQHEEAGDLLFAVVNLVRRLGIDAEAALRDTNAKFTRRFERIEDLAPGDVADLSLDEMETYWQTAKAEEKGQSTKSL